MGAMKQNLKLALLWKMECLSTVYSYLIVFIYCIVLFPLGVWNQPSSSSRFNLFYLASDFRNFERGLEEINDTDSKNPSQTKTPFWCMNSAGSYRSVGQNMWCGMFFLKNMKYEWKPLLWLANYSCTQEGVILAFIWNNNTVKLNYASMEKYVLFGIEKYHTNWKEIYTEKQTSNWKALRTQEG